MNATNTRVSAPELRKFALITGAMIALVFGIVLPWLFSQAWPTWPWLAGSILALWGIVAPASLALVHKIWMKFAEGLGWINSRIILTLVFYLVVFPTAAILRALGKDPLRRKFEAKLVSYRITSKPRARDNLEKPF